MRDFTSGSHCMQIFILALSITLSWGETKPSQVFSVSRLLCLPAKVSFKVDVAVDC